MNIVKHDEEDKSKVRSQFMQRFGNAANTKKKQVIPNLVESSESPLANTLDSAFSYAPRRMQQDELTQASIAASLAAVNVVTQPFVRMQTDLESKIETVLKELEMLRQSDEKIGSKLKKKSSDEDVEESRVKYLESLQEKQFELMSQLISAIGRDKTNEPAESKVEKKKFQIVEPAINDGQLASGFKSECLSIKKKAKTKQQRQNSQTSKLETKSGSRSRSKNKSGGSNGRSKSRNKSSSRSPSRSRSRSRGRSLDSCRHSFSEFQLGPNGYGCSVCDRSKRASRSKSPKRGSSKKRNEFLEELLDTAKSPNVSGMLNSNGNKSALFSDFKSLNDMFDDRPTLFDKYLVIKFIIIFFALK